MRNTLRAVVETLKEKTYQGLIRKWDDNIKTYLEREDPFNFVQFMGQ